MVANVIKMQADINAWSSTGLSKEQIRQKIITEYSNRQATMASYITVLDNMPDSTFPKSQPDAQSQQPERPKQPEQPQQQVTPQQPPQSQAQSDAQPQPVTPQQLAQDQASPTDQNQQQVVQQQTPQDQDQTQQTDQNQQQVTPQQLAQDQTQQTDQNQQQVTPPQQPPQSQAQSDAQLQGETPPPQPQGETHQLDCFTLLESACKADPGKEVPLSPKQGVFTSSALQECYAQGSFTQVDIENAGCKVLAGEDVNTQNNN